MAKRLHYFDSIIGLAEPIRYLLHYGKQKFEDVKYKRADWPIKSVKDSMAKRLHYFDSIIGLAEPIRYLLHYGKQKFEDVKYKFQDWPIKSVKDSLPFGQLPVYEEGNKTLNQSLAIAKYVATYSRLVPSDPWEQAVLEAMVYNLYDFWKFVVAFIKEEDPVKKQELKKEILSEYVDFFFSKFEKELKNNNGYFGGKLSWADFVFVGIIDSGDYFLGEKIENKYPSIKALVQNVHNLPGVKEYIASRKVDPMPI